MFTARMIFQLSIIPDHDPEKPAGTYVYSGFRFDLVEPDLVSNSEIEIADKIPWFYPQPAGQGRHPYRPEREI